MTLQVENRADGGYNTLDICNSRAGVVSAGERMMRTNMGLNRMIGIVSLALLGLLGLAKSSVAQTPGGAWQFDVHVVQDSETASEINPIFDSGVMTITAATVAFDADNREHSFEVPIQDISKVTADAKLRGATITLKDGKFYGVNFWDEGRRHMSSPRSAKGFTEALTAAMTGQPGPPQPPAITRPKPSFAPIPPPTVPADVPGPPAKVVVGQTVDQVGAALGQPDRIDQHPSSGNAGDKVIWYYKGLTVTFVAGRVSAVEQPPVPTGIYQ
jgi:hypothetical protein